ncbi:MAG: glycerophosphodiester phosphodiesterase [Verrucomicrobia bacterium]|nr:glycerophosphodiester phosphodiesterase [Verrucomicrobiota bacterium]
MFATRPTLAALVFTALVSSTPLRAVQIVAHRGASYDAPENTVASGKLAFQHHADALETDLWLTKDGQIIISHDLNAKRTTGRDVKLSELTLAEARQLDAGKWKDPKFAGEKLPTLEELLALIPPGKRIFLEQKAGVELVPVLKAALARTRLKRAQLVIIDFKLASAAAAKAAMPDLEVLWLLNPPSKDPKKPSPDLDEAIAQAKAAKLDGLDVNYKFPMDAAAVKKIKAAGLQLHVWTVDDPVVARQWRDLGVDGITTNRAGWLREQLTQ